VFYFDFHSPYSWLVAERIDLVLPERPVWRPISYAHVVRHGRAAVVDETRVAKPTCARASGGLASAASGR
jgi:2-hydroxychromene-2-carboxylate isomerase